MGTVVKRTARIEKINETVQMTMKVGLAYGGTVAEAATEHLAGPVAAILRELAQRTAAMEAEETARVAMMAQIERADRTIAGIRDAIWNALGRPRHSLILDYVFPDGITTYTNAAPQDRPAALEVLHSRLQSVTAPVLTKEQRNDWASQIQDLRDKVGPVVATHHPLAVKADIADATYRSVVRAGLAGVHAFKHALMILGFTESQIHDIIPDVPASARVKATPAKATTATTPVQPNAPPANQNASTTEAATPPVRSAG